jgi:hypothetical protein
MTCFDLSTLWILRISYVAPSRGRYWQCADGFTLDLLHAKRAGNRFLKS